MGGIKLARETPLPIHVRMKWIRCASLAALAGLCWLEVVAQQLEPRSYSNIPIGMNFIVGGYVYSEGSITTDATSPIQDAEVQAHNALVGYARSFGLWLVRQV